MYSVAGTTVPAFVERRPSVPPLGALPAVSPGLRSRPSLSAKELEDERQACLRVSPGLRSRPSLSGRHLVHARPRRHRVAGTTVPAFVERSSSGGGDAGGDGGCRRDYGPGLR